MFFQKAVIGLATLYAGITAQAAVVVTTGSGAGGSGGGASSTCMVMSDGTSWSGGAVGVQGSQSLNNGGTSSLAANVTFKFNIGASVDALNTQYGIGNWTITSATLTYQYTLYANNSRFNAGAGTYDIYWVANDSWVQGTNTPVYATTESTLNTWSGGDSLLSSVNYTWSTPNYTGTYNDLKTSLWSTDKSGNLQSTENISLGLTDALLNEILTASAAGDSSLSLYLMSTSNTLGLTIFTGGGAVLPTLTLEVAAVPEPASIGMLALAGAGLLLRRRK